jgi:hypothetical protein
MTDLAQANGETTAENDVNAAVPAHEEVARLAYEISCGDDAGSDAENWARAERELRDRSAVEDPETPKSPRKKRAAKP